MCSLSNFKNKYTIFQIFCTSDTYSKMLVLSAHLIISHDTEIKHFFFYKGTLDHTKDLPDLWYQKSNEQENVASFTKTRMILHKTQNAVN